MKAIKSAKAQWKYSRKRKKRRGAGSEKLRYN